MRTSRLPLVEQSRHLRLISLGSASALNGLACHRFRPWLRIGRASFLCLVPGLVIVYDVYYVNYAINHEMNFTMGPETAASVGW
jgi:hypothetical protein